MKHLLRLIMVSFCFLNLVNCSDVQEAISLKQEGNEDTLRSDCVAPITRSPRVVYDLDWENITEMPTSDGTIIWAPWVSGSSRQFSSDILDDYRKLNGWELLYNTFNSAYGENNLYFVLYNKYSGLIRMYYYIPISSNYITSRNIVHTLQLEGSHSPESPMLNFADQLIVDVNKNSRFSSVAEEWQIARGTWYAVQHELAYDDKASKQSYGSFHFSWPMKATQITNLVINGKVQGAMKGSIKMPSVDFTVSSVINNSQGSFIINGDKDVKALSALGQAFLTGAQGALKKAGAGLVEGIFNGIFGKNSNAGTDNVNLKLEATIGLTGSLEESFLVHAMSFAISGYDQSLTDGFTPKYNEPLGVFYITNRPEIIETVYITPQFNPGGDEIPPRRQYTYHVDPNSFQFIFNPSVLSRASISSINSEVVLLDSNGFYQIHGVKENIAGSFFYIGELLLADEKANIKGVRLSFDVIPNDGSAKVTIAKTFVANRYSKEIITPPGEDQW